MGTTPERLSSMKHFQKINHFPGMPALSRKDNLARNLGVLRKQFPEDYNFFPLSWNLPLDYNSFRTYAKKHKGKTYIVKPKASCQGKGIFLTQKLDEVDKQCVV